MIQSDLCHTCGCFKTANIILRDGTHIAAMPGDCTTCPPSELLQIEVICEQCERVYPYTSPMSPIQLEW